MQGLALALCCANLVLDSGGQLCFKAAAGDQHAGEGLRRWRYMLARPWIWAGIACYVVQFAVWVAFLSLVPLSEGVMLASINIVAVMLAGRLLFDERLSPMRVTGILLVTLGVAIVGAGG